MLQKRMIYIYSGFTGNDEAYRSGDEDFASWDLFNSLLPKHVLLFQLSMIDTHIQNMCLYQTKTMGWISYWQEHFQST